MPGDEFKLLCELRPDEKQVQFPVILRIEALLLCSRISPNWRSYQSTYSEPILIKDREGSEWDAFVALNRKSEALMDVEDCAGAENIYHDMIRRWPQLPFPYWYLAQRYFLSDKFEKSVEYYERAIYALEALPYPEDDPVWGGMWAYYRDKGREKLRKAVEDYRQETLKALRKKLDNVRKYWAEHRPGEK